MHLERRLSAMHRQMRQITHSRFRVQGLGFRIFGVEERQRSHRPLPSTAREFPFFGRECLGNARPKGNARPIVHLPLGYTETPTFVECEWNARGGDNRHVACGWYVGGGHRR